MASNLFLCDSVKSFVIRLQSDDEEAFKEVFTKACPKFFHPFISSYEDPEEVRNIDQHEPLNRQLNMFLKDVSYQNRVFNVRSIAKLYNNLTLSVRPYAGGSSQTSDCHSFLSCKCWLCHCVQKLANLMGMTQENAVEVVRSEMLCVKNRAEQVMWRKGPLLSGERVQILADLDIYLDMDTIHVKVTKTCVELCCYLLMLFDRILRRTRILLICLSSKFIVLR